MLQDMEGDNMIRVRRSVSAAACAVTAAVFMLCAGDGLMQAQQGQPMLLLAGASNAVGFGRVGLGVTSAPQVVMLQNGGNADLIVSAVSVQGLNAADFSVLSSNCGSVAPAGFCLVTVAFEPGANGQRSGRLIVANNAPGSPHMIPLVGTGIDPGQPQPSVGPIDPRVGFPLSFSDGISNLELCVGHETPPGDPFGSPLCLAPTPDPTQPPSVTDTAVNFGAEAFWWSAEATIDTADDVELRLVMAQEAAFVTETPRPGDQWTFGRLRIRMRGDGVPANTWFRFTHPFGVDEHLAEPDKPGDPGEIFATSDIGCFSNPCDFTMALPGNTRIARFLKCVTPAPPAGYVGNPNVLCTVTGSPSGYNRFKVERISGPGGSVLGLVAETNLFAVSGKLRSTLPAPPPPPTTVLVPGVVNQLRPAAEAAITAAGLGVGPITTQVNAAPANTVIAQSPTADTSVPTGSAVALTISLGPPANRAPVAGNDSLATTGPLTFAAATLLANDSDLDGNTLAISTVSASSSRGGSIVSAGAGSWRYTPPSGFAGVDTFTYTVTDGQASAVGTVSVTVTLPPPANRAPVAGNDSLATTGPLTFTAATLLANDGDPDGNPIAVSAVSASSTNGGSIAAAGAGSWTYTPASAFAGVDSFTYTVSDGQAIAIGTVSVTVTVPPPPPPPSVAGLVLAFGFDETAGNLAADTSASGLVGTIREAAFVPGKFGNALSFDGVNDWVTVPDAAALDLTNGMTIEAWVNPSAMSGWETVVMKERAVGDLCYVLYAHDGAPLAGGAAGPSGIVNIAGGHNTVRGPAALPLNVWTHIATTYDGTTQRFYVNGVLVDSRALGGNMPVSNRQLRIGGNGAWAGEFFRGLIDEVRVYNRALSTAELQADMNAPIR